jgi:hypothetical protein
MSWQTFKDNILNLSNSPESIADVDIVAKTYANEYDAAIKRGKDSLHQISLQKGNVEAMTQLFKAALLKGQTSTAPYDLVGEMGKGVIAYWSGATMNNFPTPIIPATGATSNVSVVTNIVVNPGQWTPPIASPSIPTQDSVDAEEAAAVERDINEEYPMSQAAYEAQFESEEDAMANNSQVTSEEAFNSIKEYNEEVNDSSGDGVVLGEDPPLGESGSLDFGSGPVSVTGTSGASGTSTASGGGSDGPDKPKPQLAGKGDEALFKKCGSGHWPAKGSPGSFEVQTTEKGKCPRYWYKVNNEYLKANCTEIMFPTKGGSKKIMVHKHLAAIVKPAIDKIKAQGLEKYIENCAGGLAVRNVTCGSRFSNHAWGTAIDMNTSVYPYGYNFKADGIYSGKTKVRDLNDFDKGFQRVATIFKSQGMTWLSNNDPMHVSIYE